MNIEIINQTYIRILTYHWLSELMNEKSKTINNKKYLSTQDSGPTFVPKNSISTRSKLNH